MGFDALSGSATMALAAAVLHFLWQGALIGVLAGIAFWSLRRSSAQSRYLVGCAALVTSVAMFVGTFLIVLNGGLSSPPDLEASSSLFLTSGRNGGSTLFDLPLFNLPPFNTLSLDALPGAAAPFNALGLTALWMLGAALLAGRTWRQWLAARRFPAVDVAPVSAQLQTVFDIVCREMGVHRAVRLVQSSVAEVPMVVGWLSPVVLIPASVVSSVPVGQLRSVLAHEVAHIRRHDYFINGLQRAVEVMLFFHPVVWWLSHRVRVEREHCCDDDAVRATGDALAYANALYKLETIRTEETPIAMAATGGSFMQRIKRIVRGDTTVGPSRRGGWVVAVAVTVIGSIGVGFAYNAVDSANVQAIAAAQPVIVNVDRDADLDAYAAKLDALVASGDLTSEQAAAKLAGWTDKDGADKSEFSLEEVTAKLDGLVAVGDLTSEQAAEKLAGWTDKDGADKSEFSLEEVTAKLDALVAAGDLTAEEAAEKLAGWTDKDGADKLEISLEEWAEKFEWMVANGKMTAEEAEAKLAGIGDKDGAAKPEISLEEWAEKFEWMVANGKMTVADADAKLAALAS